jgi:excisionase family DNA binding protein
MHQPPPALINPREAARQLGISLAKVYELLAPGQLGVKIGRSRRILWSEGQCDENRACGMAAIGCLLGESEVIGYRRQFSARIPGSSKGNPGTPLVDDPLDYVDFADVLQHGDPSNWSFQGEKVGSGVPAHSPSAPPGTLKIYKLYLDEFGDEHVSKSNAGVGAAASRRHARAV